MPHGQDVERAAELEAARLRGEPQRELDQVREALVALALEVVLGRPQRVVAEVVHELRDVARGEERLAQPLVVIAPLVGRRALQPDVLELDLADVQHVEPFDHRSCPLLPGPEYRLRRGQVKAARRDVVLGAPRQSLSDPRGSGCTVLTGRSYGSKDASGMVPEGASLADTRKQLVLRTFASTSGDLARTAKILSAFLLMKFATRLHRWFAPTDMRQLLSLPRPMAAPMARVLAGLLKKPKAKSDKIRRRSNVGLRLGRRRAIRSDRAEPAWYRVVRAWVWQSARDRAVVRAAHR